MKPTVRIILAGVVGSFVSNGVLGALFSSPPIQAILYNPEVQSVLYRELTTARNLPVSVAGLVVLGVVHSWLFAVLRESIPGRTVLRQGLFWGVAIWAMYWLIQEWWIYRTMLHEPVLLCLFELVLLLLGSLVEGVIIAWVLRPRALGPS